MKTKKADTCRLVGIFLMCIAGAALSVYFLNITHFEIADALFLLAFIFFSLLASAFLDGYVERRYLFLLFLILACELFFRTTLYGRADFAGDTVLTADRALLEGFVASKVNLVPFGTVKRFFYYSVLSPEFIVNVIGNIFILTPVPIFLSLAKKEKKLTAVCGILLTLALSLTAEVLQLFFMCGSPDIDDLMLNTLGGAVGAALFSFAEAKSRGLKSNKKNNADRQRK